MRNLLFVFTWAMWDLRHLSTALLKSPTSRFLLLPRTHVPK